LEEVRDRLELKEQELDDCRTLMRRTEAEKAALQKKVRNKQCFGSGSRRSKRKGKNAAKR
jgi:hypothetical protein